MAPHEYYIREASEQDARGPFNFEQMVSLADNGQVTADTLYYDAAAEQWVVIGANAEVKEALFPQKKKLQVKAKEIQTLNKASDTQAPITVDDMLAAAEGRTSDTKDRKDPTIAAAKAARIGMWAALLSLVLAAAGELLPSSDAILAMNMDKLLAQPLVFLGALDLFLAVLVGLGVVTLYPFIRFRAALGLGFFAFVFFAHGQSLPLATAVAGSVGLYLCTIYTGMLPVAIAAAAGIAGMGATAYFLLSA